MIDPTVIPDFTNGVIINGIGYTTLKESNQKSLTESGLAHAAALGTGLMTFLGWKGYTLCVFYFVLGSLVTKIKSSIRVIPVIVFSKSIVQIILEVRVSNLDKIIFSANNILFLVFIVDQFVGNKVIEKYVLNFYSLFL